MKCGEWTNRECGSFYFWRVGGGVLGNVETWLDTPLLCALFLDTTEVPSNLDNL